MTLLKLSLTKEEVKVKNFSRMQLVKNSELLIWDENRLDREYGNLKIKKHVVAAVHVLRSVLREQLR